MWESIKIGMVRICLLSLQHFFLNPTRTSLAYFEIFPKLFVISVVYRAYYLLSSTSKAFWDSSWLASWFFMYLSPVRKLTSCTRELLIFSTVFLACFCTVDLYICDSSSTMFPAVRFCSCKVRRKWLDQNCFLSLYAFWDVHLSSYLIPYLKCSGRLLVSLRYSFDHWQCAQNAWISALLTQQ